MSVALVASAVVFPIANISASTLLNTSTGAASETTSAASTNLSGTSVTGSTNTSVNTTTSNDAMTSSGTVNAGVNTNTQSDTSSKVNLGSGASIGVDRGDVESDNTTSIMTSGQVRTQEDLKAFAESSLRGDANLEGMTFSDSMVDVAYKSKGRFLAIIPMTFTAMARVKADGDVSIKYPWYHFLVTSEDNANLEASMKSEIQAMLNSSAKGSLTASQEAAIAARVQAILKDNYNATASGNANANARANSNTNSAINR